MSRARYERDQEFTNYNYWQPIIIRFTVHHNDSLFLPVREDWRQLSLSSRS